MCVPGDVTFYGDEHMAKRPLQQLVQAMRDLGVAVDCETGCPPLTIHGTGFPSGKGESHGKAGFLVLNNAFLAPKHCLSRSKTLPSLLSNTALGTVSIPGDKSSQYFSALMLSAGMAAGPVEIEVIGELVSRPYIDMTIQMVEDFGGR